MLYPRQRNRTVYTVLGLFLYSNKMNMKHYLPAVCLSILILIVQNVFAQNINDDFKKLDWLQGSWIRINSKPGRTTYETWQKISADEWNGQGVNMKGTDTVLVEKIKLIIKDDAIYYVADVPENKEPVYFKLIEITDNGFICENAQHDFPKKISYQKEGDKLRAIVSGNGKSIDYLFIKN